MWAKFHVVKHDQKSGQQYCLLLMLLLCCWCCCCHCHCGCYVVAAVFVFLMCCCCCCVVVAVVDVVVLLLLLMLCCCCCFAAVVLLLLLSRILVRWPVAFLTCSYTSNMCMCNVYPQFKFIDCDFCLFVTQDVVYPPLFTQTLEECWEHEHFKRPSAENIHKVISCHLRLDANHASQQSGNERPSILLDSFVLHPVNWISASHCSNLGGTGFEICAALCGQEGLLDQGLGQSIVLASVMYNSENEKSEMELGVSFPTYCWCMPSFFFNF